MSSGSLEPGPAGRTRRPTSADVAREAGLSRATVGYVLNNVAHQTIPEATRQRVFAAAAKLGYTPFAAARNLRSGRSDVVVCLLPDWPVGHAMLTMLEALSGQLEQRGFTFVTHPRSATSRSTSEIWKALSPAVVLTFEPLPAVEAYALEAAGIRAVTVHEGGDDLSYGFTEERVGQLQVEHLGAAGRHTLGYAYPADPRVGVFALPRLRGVRRAAADLGLAQPLVCEVASESGALDRALEVWQRAGVDAVCGYNDELAIGVLGAASRRGLRVPDGLAVIGVDDVAVAALIHPGLTTISTDHGLRAARVAARLAGENPTLLPGGAWQIIRRESA